MNGQKQLAIIAKLSTLGLCVSPGDASDLLMRKLMKKIIFLVRNLHEYETDDSDDIVNEKYGRSDVFPTSITRLVNPGSG